MPEFATYEPRDFPALLRAFLAAISVQPNITIAARATAAAMLPTDAAREAQIPELRAAYAKDSCSENLAALNTAIRSQRKVASQAQAIRRQHAQRSQVPEYKQAFEAAYKLGVQSMEDYATEVAMDGWMEPVYQGGSLVGFKRKFSLQALFRRLEKEMPDEYGRKQKTEVSGNLRVGITSLTDEELDRLARGYLERTTNRAGDPATENAVPPAGCVLPGDGTAP